MVVGKTDEADVLAKKSLILATDRADSADERNGIVELCRVKEIRMQDYY
jgi:hypothetical protein